MVLSLLVSRVKSNLASISPRFEDQFTIVVAGLLAVGVMALVHFGGRRTIAAVGSAPAFWIDPNSASQAELLLLPRVGPSLAKAILSEREKQPFENPQDVGRTRGIGDKTLVGLLPHLRMRGGGR